MRHEQSDQNDQKKAQGGGFYIRQRTKTVLYFLFVWLLMPALAQIIFCFLAVFLGLLLPKNELIQLVSMVFFAILIPLGLGFFCRFNKSRLPTYNQTFWQRYKVEVLIILGTLALCCGSLLLSHNMFVNKQLAIAVWIGMPSFFLLFISLLLGNPFYLFALVPVACYSLYFLGVLFKTWRLGCFKVGSAGLLPVMLIAVFLGAGCAWRLHQQAQGMLTAQESAMQQVSDGGSSKLHYTWDDIGSRYESPQQLEDMVKAGLLTPLAGETQLYIPNNFPNLDGATALFPIYASAVQGIYKAPRTQKEKKAFRSIVTSSRTPNAYQRLIDGEVDLIFVAGPSDKQIEAAKAKGVELTLTPIGKEAFVFLVNEKNPVHSLTVEQIRDIYTGKIKNWNEVGGTSHVIRAFQRPEGSGSQTAMLKQVMQGTPLREPLREEYRQGMGGMVVSVANYRNAENAIGYSFRFYATEMNKVNGLRLLAVNGVEPTRENIRNGSYPFSANFYMVTARPVSENTQKLMDWFVSGQGQQLINDVGYVSLSDSVK